MFEHEKNVQQFVPRKLLVLTGLTLHTSRTAGSGRQMLSGGLLLLAMSVFVGIKGPRVNLAYHPADFARVSFVNDARICGTYFWRDLTRARHLLMSREKVGNMTRI